MSDQSSPVVRRALLPPDGHCWIAGHRGISGRFPENTRVAFQAAVSAGADAIECDLQLTIDDRIVVCHDSSLERFGHPGVEITHETLKRLRLRDLGTWFAPEFHAERLMTLEELLDEFGSRLPLLLELKTETLAPRRVETMARRVLDIVTQFHLQETVSFLCFDDAVLGHIAQTAAWAVLVYNTHEPHGLTTEFLAQRPWLSAVDGNISRLDEDTVQTIRSQERYVFCFTCDTEEELVKAQHLAVDAVITSDVRQAHSLLGIPAWVRQVS